MIDIKLTSDGDLAVSETGDIALTGNGAAPADTDTAVCTAQLAKIALATDRGDFLLHPELGNELNKLVGHPNNQATARAGIKLITDALKGLGITNKITIDSWPINLNTIGYEVRISVGSTGKDITFTLSQALDSLG